MLAYPRGAEEAKCYGPRVMLIRPTAHSLLSKGACYAAWCGESHLSSKLTLSISVQDNYMWFSRD